MSNAAVTLKSARAACGLSRSGLAARAGVPTSTVSRIEAGTSDPTVGMLERLVGAAGMRLDLAARPEAGATPTLASLAASARVKPTDADDDSVDWTRLRAFVDWGRRHPLSLSEALRDPPMRTDDLLDALLAALAEELADEQGIAAPRWTRAVGPVARPWAQPGSPAMRARASARTAEPFRRRHIVLARDALFRDAESASS